MPEMDEGTELVDEDALYNPLLEKIYGGKKEALEAEIEARKAAGALNRMSALRKIVAEKGRREVGSIEVAGYFLQTYRRQPNDRSTEAGMSVYLATKQGIRTIHAETPNDLPSPKDHGLTAKVFGEKQHWTALTELENVLYGTHTLRSVKGKTSFAPAKQEQIGPDLWEMASDLPQIKDGQGLWRAYVAAVLPVRVFENGQPTEEYAPILGNNGVANLAIGLAGEIDRKTSRPVGQAQKWVNITSEAQLKTFLGEYFKETFLMEENAARELRDALLGTPVLVFGSGTTPQNPRLTKVQRERMKEPKISMRFGRGVIAPWTPPQRAA